MGQAAEALGVSRRTVERLAAAGSVRTFKIGGRRFVPTAEVERVLTRGTGEGP